jgi:ATP-binding cassette subfamily B protein
MDARLDAYLAQLPVAEAVPDATAAAAHPGTPFGAQLRSIGIIRRGLALVGARAGETCLIAAAWAFIGSGALSGRVNGGWLMAWALCLATTWPLRLASRWLEGVLAVGISGLIKQRLLAGAMRVDVTGGRARGLGELLGEVLETDSIDRLAISGGLAALQAATELVVCAAILAWGAAAFLEWIVLAAACVAVLAMGAINTRRRIAWTQRRLALTGWNVENMIAHRTRAVQQPRDEWHREDDALLDEYAASSASLDRTTAVFEGLLPRAYMLAALAALAPSFMSSQSTTAERAITLGVVLFATDALQRLTFGIPGIAAALIAWNRVQPTLAAATPPDERRVAERDSTAEAAPQSPLFQGWDLTFAYAGRPSPACEACTLELSKGDAVLLEGESGSGKSTLASLLAGTRRPASGVVLSGGLDLPTRGETAWRRRIAMVPQGHENHILSAPLAFNLLLGRPHPHSDDDLREAREVCEELGLGPLIERMPAGLNQMVGETGWQLSHGERSRVFIARALLQRAEVVMLDESIGDLDPETLQQSVECVRRRAGALLLIAHP